MGWEYLGILLIVAAVLCAIGFYKYVYFLSIGYGFSVAGLGIAIAVLFHTQMQPVHYLQCLVFLLYGIRLSGFLLYREIKNATYRKTLSNVTDSESSIDVYKRQITHRTTIERPWKYLTSAPLLIDRDTIGK